MPTRPNDDEHTRLAGVRGGAHVRGDRPAPSAPGVRTGAHARGPQREVTAPAPPAATAMPAATAAPAAIPPAAADDPKIVLDRQSDADLFEPIPPFPTRTEREAEFYSLGDGEMFLNVGPQHPATHGVLRLVLKLSGEKVVDVDPVIGYLHRGVEKICENSDYYHVIDHVDPLEYLSSLFQEWSAVLAFEKLMDVQVPRRAEYIRVLTAELLRISSHTLYMGFLALDLGGITPILYGFIERDEIVEMLAAVTGARMLFNYYRIGGVNGDLNHEFMSRLGDWMSRAAKQTEANATLLNENEIFVRRARGVGVLDRETALRMGVTGGNLRASGVAFDVRRAHPYSVYPELQFNVPTRDEGDSLARYLIRVDEVRESIRIIDQCLHNMPDGPVMAKLPRLLRPRPGRAWAAVEGPRGMMGVYAISDGSDQPFRFRIHDPSLLNLETVPLLLPGNLLADTMAIVSSLDPVMGDIDK